MTERPIAPSRWLAKKGARRLVATVGSLRRPPGVRVVTYHRFGPSTRMPFTVTAESFEREMAFLARTGRAVTLEAVERHVAGTDALPDGAVLVTMDDGDPSVRTVAMPILLRHRVPAVVYALGGTPEGFEVMTSAELREVADAGLTIGSHSMTHRAMGQLPLAEAQREARDSKARLEDLLGRAVTSFAYPFGIRTAVSDAAAAILAESGYRTGFTSLHGAIRAGDPSLAPMLLPRVKVESGDPDWLFPRLCDGAMDAWRLVDGGLSALQKPQAAGART